MSHTDNTPRERRWGILSESGQHSWLGRHTDPTDAELAAASAQLSAQGIAAWLAIVEGVYWSADPLTVLIVRPLNGEGDPEAAIRLFHEARREKLADLD